MRSADDTIDPNLGKIYGHCRLERKLGEGGMGMVYLATHTTLKKPVAVKLLRSDPSSDPNAAERFLREARSAAKVEHPAVVQVYDIGQHSGRFYIVMQYVEGMTLEERVREAGALPLREAMAIMASICEAVREAHAQGIIHRDIKPDNILLGKDGSAKLTDFGLARVMEGDANLSRTGWVFGTPHFMSPEQAVGGKVDHRSDIFSLGATFYRLVTGRHPFQATTLMAVVFKLTHEVPPTVREVNPSVAPEISELIAEMMEKEPGKRIKSVDDVLARLKEIAALLDSGHPRREAPSSRKMRSRRRERYGRPGRLRQILPALAALIALAAAALLVMQRYDLFRPVQEAIARTRTAWTPAAAKAQPKPDADDAAKALRAAASMAAWEDSGTSYPTSDPGVPSPPPGNDGGPPPGEGGLEAPAPLHSPPSPPGPAGLEERVKEFISEIQAEPVRVSRFLDQESVGEKGAAFTDRWIALAMRRRPRNAPPPSIAETILHPGGDLADVRVEGLGRPIFLRWVKRGGEWYLIPLRQSSEP